MPFQRIHQSVRTVSIGSRIDDLEWDSTRIAEPFASCHLTPFPSFTEALDSGQVDDLVEWLVAYRLDQRGR